MFKKMFLALAIVGMLTATGFATYSGDDKGSYKGSQTIHFTVAVSSQTTAAVFAVASYSSTFDTMDDMEFSVVGSSGVFVSSFTATTTGTLAAPSSNVRYMPTNGGELSIYKIDGRNKASIFIKCEDGTSNTSIITGTIKGH